MLSVTLAGTAMSSFRSRLHRVSHRILLGVSAVPGVLVVLFVAIALSSSLSLHDSYGVAVVGHIDSMKMGLSYPIDNYI